MTSADSSSQSDTKHQPVAEPFTYWHESDGHFLAYLNAYPNHWMQGEDREDLKAQLLDHYHEFSKQDLPGILKVGKLVVA
jgi:hypothetical protein